MAIINLTGHPITILSPATPVTYGAQDKFKSTPLSSPDQLVVDRVIPEDGLARVTKNVTDQDPVDGIPTEGAVFGEISNLPEFMPGIFFIVSAMTVSAAVAHGRTTKDLLTPGTTVREIGNPGKVLGTFKLQRN